LRGLDHLDRSGSIHFRMLLLQHVLRRVVCRDKLILRRGNLRDGGRLLHDSGFLDRWGIRRASQSDLRFGS
jgi:hypothetical protein